MTTEADRRALMDAVVPGSYEAQQEARAAELANNAALRFSEEGNADAAKYRLQEPQSVPEENVDAIRSVVTTGNLSIKHSARTDFGLTFGRSGSDERPGDAPPRQIPLRHGTTAGVYFKWEF